MITRADYIQGRATHREFYAQFVDDSVIAAVVNQIGADRILASTDAHFNDIPLDRWDRVAVYSPITFRSVGDYRSKAGHVCVVKEAARQYREATSELAEGES